MNKSADVVAQTVREEVVNDSQFPQIFHCLVFSELYKPEVDEAVEHELLSLDVELLVVESDSDVLDRVSVALEHEVVNVGLFLSEFAVNWVGASDVRAVVVDLGAGIDQHHVSVFDVTVVHLVVQNCSIFACGADFFVWRDSVMVKEPGKELK